MVTAPRKVYKGPFAKLAYITGEEETNFVDLNFMDHDCK